MDRLFPAFFEIQTRIGFRRSQIREIDVAHRVSFFPLLTDPARTFHAASGLLAWFLMLVPCGEAGEPFTAFQGTQRSLSSPMPADEIGGLHFMDKRTWCESWFHVIRSDSGHTLFITFLVSNISLTPPDAGVEVSVCMPDGSHRFFKRVYDEEDLSVAPDAFSVRIGPNRIGGSHPEYRVSVQEQGIHLDLRLNARCHGIRFRDGRVTFGKKRDRILDHSTHIPYAFASGVLRLDDETIPVSGWAYADHAYQSVPSSDFSTRWRSLRFFKEDVGVALIQMDLKQAYGGGTLAWMYVMEGGRVRCFTDRVRFQGQGMSSDPETGYVVPNRFTLEGLDSACPLRCTVEQSRRIDRVRVVDHLGLVQRTILKTFIADPVFYRFRDRVNLTLGSGPGSRHLSGEGIHEVVVIGND